MQKLKKGDTVQVIAGKDLGERGEVLKVILKEDRVIVQGVNIVKRHRKARQAGQRQVPAQIVEMESPLNISNVMVVCPKCDQPSRIGIKQRDDGTRVRFCKKCNSELD